MTAEMAHKMYRVCILLVLLELQGVQCTIKNLVFLVRWLLNIYRFVSSSCKCFVIVLAFCRWTDL